jgi:uncharacterized protein YkuJ
MDLEISFFNELEPFALDEMARIEAIKFDVSDSIVIDRL